MFCIRVVAALISFCVLSGWVRAADNEMASIRAEMQAMREAYEGRIASLETEVKVLRQTGGAPRSTEKSINDTLFKKEGTPPNTSNVPGNAGPGIPSNAVRSASQLTLGGYTEFTYTDRQTRTPQFDQLKTVLELSAKIQEHISLYMEIEDEHAGAIAGPEETDGEVEIEQAYIDYKIDKAVNFRAGVILVPVGHYNLNHEGFVNNLVDRPLVDRRIIPTTWYDEGLGFYGTPIDTDKFGLSYEAYMYNPAVTDGVDPLSGFRGIRNENKTPTSDQKAGAVRVAMEPARGCKAIADSLEFGLSAYVSGFGGFNGVNDNGDTVRFGPGRLYVTAADVSWEKKNIGFRGEAALDHADSGNNITGKRQDAWGYYAEGYYKFWPGFLSHSPFGKFKDPKLVAALRYEYVNLDNELPATPSVQRLTAGISYRPLPNTVFKFDYQNDWLGSGLAGQDYDESETGLKKHLHAFLFSVSTGF